jgi:hypothetical protein
MLLPVPGLRNVLALALAARAIKISHLAFSVSLQRSWNTRPMAVRL